MNTRLLQGRVIHVNEDGWVIINKGARDGVILGQKFAVLGEHRPRQIHDPFGDARRSRQVALRIETAYELLRVILVESQCCIAISERVPLERTPQAFTGPDGELLLYTPAPLDWSFDALELDEAEEEAAAQDDTDADGVRVAEEPEADDESVTDASEAEAGDADTPDEQAGLINAQQERLWDGALPLNAVQVGDEVIAAQPYVPGSWAPGSAPPPIATGDAEALPLPGGSQELSPPPSYDWLKPS